SATWKVSGIGATTTEAGRSRLHARVSGTTASSARSRTGCGGHMAPELARRARRRNQRSSDRLEVRRRIEKVVARVVEDPVERSVRLDAQHLIDAAKREVVAAAGLVTAGVHEPCLHADALNECRRLPR